MNVRGFVIAFGDFRSAFATFMDQDRSVRCAVLPINGQHVAVVMDVPRSDLHFPEFVPARVVECARIPQIALCY